MRARPSILGMAGPLIVSFWMRAAATFVDTVFAALLGDAEVAAIGLTSPLEFLMIAVWVGVSTGLTSNLSRALGADHHAKVEQYLASARRLVFVIAPAFFLLGVGVALGAPHLPRLDAEVAEGFRVYGALLICGSAVTTFWSIIPDSLLKAHQDTRSTMWAGIWSNVVNLVLNALFVLGFGWGLAGIALSTVIGRLAGLAYAFVRAAAHERARRARPGDRETGAAHPYRAILDLAIPASMTFVLMATEMALINFLLSRAEHPREAIAAHSIYHRVVLFTFQPIIATSVAMLPYAAHRIGAGDWEGVRRGLLQARWANVAYSVLAVAPVLWLSAPWMARHLTESPLTYDYTRLSLYAVPVACLVSAPFLLCRPVFEAMQQGRPGLIMAIVRYVVLAGPLAFVGMALARDEGWPGLYGLIAGTLIAAAVASVAFQAWLANALGARARA